MKKTLLMLLFSIILLVAVGCSSGNSNETENETKSNESSGTVVVGGKNYIEQDILVHIISTLIEEHTDLKVERKPFLGGTQVIQQAVLSGEVDIYPELTGTAWSVLLGKEGTGTPEEIYNSVKDEYEKLYDLIWLEPIGFNNTYALTMKSERAEELGIETFSDLAEKSPELDLGSDQEFLERADGFSSVEEVYGFDFKNKNAFDWGILYKALLEDEVDVISGFSTDGRIIAFDLKVLEDDKNVFLPYYPAPVVRAEVLEKHPELEDVLNKLSGKIDDLKMATLNGKVDLDGQDPREVAEEWLREEGLIE